MIFYTLGRLKKFWNFGLGRTALASFCAHSVSITIGICQGYSAILLPQLDASYEFVIGTDERSWLASLGAVSNPIGSIASGLIAEYVGRRRSIQASGVPFVIGWLCIAFSNDLTMLYVGRFISGIGAGMATASYTYVGEIATPNARGLMQTIGPVCASFGILLTYILGYYIEWTQVALVGTITAILTTIAMQFMPESPAYLYKKNKRDLALNNCEWFTRNTQMAQQWLHEYDDGNDKMATEDTTMPSINTNPYLRPETIKPFFMLVTLFFLQELSGIYTLLFYAVNFFDETDLKLDSYLSSIIVGTLRFGTSLMMAALIQRYGRKMLCMTSSAGMTMTMLALLLYEIFGRQNGGGGGIGSFVPLICVVLNVCSSMFGMLPVPWILVGEMFPLAVRPIVGGIVICIAQCFVFLCVKIYPDMVISLGFPGTISTFLVASILAFGYSRWVLIETHGKTLKEIETLFRKENNCDDNKNNCDDKDRVYTVQIDV